MSLTRNRPDRPDPAVDTPANLERVSRLMTRVGVMSVVGLLTVAGLSLGIPWGRYRYHHVVVGQAVIKGTVTKIGGRIEGRIRSIEVEIGQHVCQGQVLLRLDDRHIQPAVERARAQLQSATT